ncbi:MAG: hypothetical protein CSA22_07815 [Deltaproteobacteria bacterium]|nr:MAG: hypothetical protein CSA22_07815 [Deltaproteobacteria bacterium]
MDVDNRKFDRFDSLNLLSYVCHVREEAASVKQGMGRTLDVSEGGIQLETHVPLDLDHTVSLNIGLKEDMCVINGTVVYCRKAGNGMYESGIQFFDVDLAAKRTLQAFIDDFIRAKDQEPDSFDPS